MNRVGFRPFLNKISEGQKVDILIDTNALIALGEELHPNYEEVTSFVGSIHAKANLTLYATVTTKSEYLDYQRRRFMTEGLLSLASYPEINLSQSAKAKLSTIKRRKNTREKKRD